jgi:alpha-beta hydrolase superfamily lysophospholipase
MSVRAFVLPCAILGLALSAAYPQAASTQAVTLRTEDGITLAGTWHAPSRPGPAVVFVHMFQRTRRDWDSVASRLSSEGIGALTFDLRGHGESQGTQPQDLSTLQHDVRAARRFLVGRVDVVPGRVGLAGASLGANLAAVVAAEDASITCVALLSPSADYRGIRIEAAIRKLGSRPLMLIASDDDPYASRSTRDLQKASGGKAETMLLHAAGHGTTMLVRAPELAGSLVDWLRRRLL